MDIKRYEKQIMLPELGLSGQEKLTKAKVLMIGAGGLGCPILQYLTTAGIGTIGIIDHDIINESNLHRQILYSIDNVGKLKVDIAKKYLEKMVPSVVINTYPEKLTNHNAKNLFEKYDVIIDGSDNFETRYLVDSFCITTNKPLIFGSIFKFEAQISVFNYLGSASYKDLFPEPPENIPNCSDSGIINTLAGIAGLMMANETIKLITGIGKLLVNKLWIINSLTLDIKILNLKNNIIENEKNDDITSNSIHKISRENLDNNCFLIDVRENYEYEEDNKGGVNIPLNELFNKLEELPLNKKIVFYCNTNNRSKVAVNYLKSKGFKSVFILED